MNRPCEEAQPGLPSFVIASSTGRNSPGLDAIERRHRQAVVLQLLPVQLGPLLVPRPDDRPPSRMDPVCHLHRSKPTPGSTEDSANATPSNALWSSFSTITCHGASRSPPGSPARDLRTGVSVAGLIGRRR